MAALLHLQQTISEDTDRLAAAAAPPQMLKSHF